MEFADKFSFTHDTTTQKYFMEKEGAVWRFSKEGEGRGEGIWCKEDITQNFELGFWQNYEPELVFPFTFQHKYSEDIIYTADKLNNSQIKLTWKRLDGSSHETEWSITDTKEHLKDGTWIVTSVGPQKAPETSTSSQDDNSVLAIKIDSSQLVEATERVNKLAQAVENLNIALESLEEISGWSFKYKE